jgi:hypothetical protein
MDLCCCWSPGQHSQIGILQYLKRADYAALKSRNMKQDQFSAASVFLSGKPMAAASFTS